MKTRILLSLFTALACSSCVTHSFSHASIGSGSGHALNEIEASNGETHRYVLHYGSNGSPTVNHTVERSFEVARIGVNVRSIDAKLAESMTVAPWEGVLVDFVAGDSPADRAKLGRGDLLLEVGGTKITNREQFIEVVESTLQPGVETTILVSIGVVDARREVSARKLTPGVRVVKETLTDTVELDAPIEIEDRTGMQLVTIPADLAREIWPTEGSRVYVSGVRVGSPAYLSGLRGGDHLLACDGDDVNSAEDVRIAIEGKSGRHQFSVVGKQGSYESSTKVENSLQRRTRFGIPIVINYSSSMRRTRVSFLNFIFQFGFNYTGEYQRTDSREPKRTSHLSILPLGMFEFDRTPTSSKNTLFWFITWRTSD
ncbi:MAG: membrane-associated protease RseP (regulator of RpoE activity) [Chlamydiales bacterium]|jgi:membrane-associated protease RseP (regulator of RpoE activity)